MSTQAARNPRRKNERLNIRATEVEKQRIEQAAQVVRLTSSQFVMESALSSAEQVLADRSRYVLSPDKWQEFVTALDRPAQEIPALKRAAKKASPFSER